MTYTHTPPAPPILGPKIIYSKDLKSFYFLSPFKIIQLEKIYGSGFPMSDCFFHIQCLEFEQICISKGPPKSIQDLGVKIKMHFSVVIIKNLWFVPNSLLVSETKIACENTVKFFMKDKLRN